jgi:hypothetical protein
MPKRELRLGGFYRHYKNKPYKVHGIVRHSESLVEHVLYEALYPNESGQMWVRPLDMFMSDVVVDGITRPRFADDEGPTPDEIAALNPRV